MRCSKTRGPLSCPTANLRKRKIQTPLERLELGLTADRVEHPVDLKSGQGGSVHTCRRGEPSQRGSGVTPLRINSRVLGCARLPFPCLQLGQFLFGLRCSAERMVGECQTPVPIILIERRRG